MAHNSPVHGDERGVAANGQGPRPVPDLGIPGSFGQVPAVGVGPAIQPAPSPGVPRPDTAPVTDEDRQAYGRLLDRAFERGLIGSYDYEVRLRELSEATSIDAMKTIVTELPVFAVPSPAAPGRRPSLGRVSTPADGGTGNPWTKLVVMVLVVVIAFVVLALYAEHVVHGRTNGNSGAPAAAAPAPSPSVRSPRP